MYNKRTEKGFTLVELAIVLVIIGLLVGGVLQGQELIKQAQINNTISKYTEFDTAVNTFRAKYRQLPGDMTKATSFGLNRPKGVTSGNVNVSASFTAAGDGNGDGYLSSFTAAGVRTTPVYSGEFTNFWAHLSNATLISGNYAQNPGSATASYTAATVPGVNIPDASVGVGIAAVTINGALYYVSGMNATGVITGTTAVTDYTLSPEEAYGIDVKIDDGLPNAGQASAVSAITFSATADTATTPLSGAATATSCHGPNAAAFAATNDYNLAATSTACKIIVKGSS